MRDIFNFLFIFTQFFALNISNPIVGGTLCRFNISQTPYRRGLKASNYLIKIMRSTVEEI